MKKKSKALDLELTSSSMLIETGGEKMKKYIINVKNTFTDKYENIEVSEEVYTAYMRTGWNIKDNDDSFFKHQIQFSVLLGNLDDAIENFKELMNSKEDIEEIAELNIELKILFKAMKQLSNDELKLISLIYFEDKTERECAEIYNISQKNIKKADFVQTQQTHKKL